MSNEQFLYNRPLFPAQLNMAHPLTRGLVGCWVMNENDPTGMRVWDSSSYRNHGMVTGAKGSWQARTFNGTTDYISIPDSDYWAFGTGNFSIEMWLKIADVSSNFLSQSNNDLVYVWAINYAGWTANKLHFNVVDNSIYNRFYADNSFPINTWTHLCISRRGTTAADWLVTFDGVNQAKTVAIGSPYDVSIANYTQNMIVGARLNAGAYANPLNGMMGLLRIYKGRGLTLPEIRELYLNPYDMFQK